LNISVAESRSQEDLPEGKKSACGTRRNIFVEGTRGVPIVKAKAMMIGAAPEVNDKSSKDATDDEHDFETSEYNLRLCKIAKVSTIAPLSKRGWY
jgi:hypothetical protein